MDANKNNNTHINTHIHESNINSTLTTQSQSIPCPIGVGPYRCLPPREVHGCTGANKSLLLFVCAFLSVLGSFRWVCYRVQKWRSSRRSSTQKAGRAVRYHDSLDVGASHCLHVVCRFKKDDGLHTVLYVTKPILNLGKVTTWHTFCLHVMLSHSQPESFFT